MSENIQAGNVDKKRESRGIDPSDITSRIAAANMPPTSSSEMKPGDWVFLAALNEQLLDKELRLSNDRMTWMMASQTVLFAAFYILLVNKDNPSNSPMVKQIATRLLDWIPVVAIIIIGCALAGIIAARLVGRSLERERSFYQEALYKIFNVNIPDIGSRRKGVLYLTRTLGSLLSWAVPALLLIVWISIIVSRLEIAFRAL